MSTATSQTGQVAEDIACDFLKSQGLQLIARNYRCRLGELDLVFRDGSLLIVVEVRARRSQRYGGAVASVGAAKQRRLILATRQFIATHPGAEQMPVRFDVLALNGRPDSGADTAVGSVHRTQAVSATYAIEWIKDAFELY